MRRIASQQQTIAMAASQVLAEVAGEDIAAMSKARVPRRQQQVQQPAEEEEEPSEAEQDLQQRLNAVRS